MPEDFSTLLDDSSIAFGPGQLRDEHHDRQSLPRGALVRGVQRGPRLLRLRHAAQERSAPDCVAPEALTDHVALTALEREVEKLVTIQHPNLLGVFGFETVDRGSFLVLEWTEGFSVLDLLKARRELDADEALMLLHQAAAGADHALNLGLGGLEFGLHQVHIHFPQPVEREKLLRTPLSQWPQFFLKLYPVGSTRAISNSETWAGGQTVLGGAASAAPGADARPYLHPGARRHHLRITRRDAVPARLARRRRPRWPLHSALDPFRRGNDVLHRALDPARSFPSPANLARRSPSWMVCNPPPRTARFYGSGGYRPSLREDPARKTNFHPCAEKVACGPHRWCGGSSRCRRRTILPIPLAEGQKDENGPDDPESAAGRSLESRDHRTNGTENSREHAARHPHPGHTGAHHARSGDTASHDPTPANRQELLKSAVVAAQDDEEKGDWGKSLTAWLKVAKDYPEFAVGKNHLETLLNTCANRPSPIGLRSSRHCVRKSTKPRNWTSSRRCCSSATICANRSRRLLCSGFPKLRRRVIPRGLCNTD